MTELPPPPPGTWKPTEEQVRRSRLHGFLVKMGVANVEELNDVARRDPERFWAATIDDVGIGWRQRPLRMRDTSEGVPFTRWWRGGRLNLASNAADRWAASQPGRDAVVWEADDGATLTWSYLELAAETARCANALRELGVSPGEAVGLCLPMIPQTVALFLACAKIGAIVCPLFSGYGAGAIATRLNDCAATVLVVADGFLRRGRPVLMKPTADEVAAQVPSLRSVVVVRRLRDAPVSMTRPRDVWYHDVTVAQPSTAETHDSDADEPCMLLYTSGTTGRPKGTVHVQGGFPIKVTQDMAHCFDVGGQDRLLWFTDIGWMMGPWAICGALTIGATLVLFEGAPDHPGPDRLWAVVERHRVSVLGVAPTVVRALMRHGDAPVAAHDLSSLRVLGSSGEPWNAEPWRWFLDVVGGGRCPIINYSGGTEVSGGILAGNMLTPLQPCSFAGPCPGMDADVLDVDGTSVRGRVGELVVRSPWPGMTRGFWNDRERYLQTYWSRWPNVWVHGDWAEVDGGGLWYIRGRSDDTIKVAGKRLGPAEVESALVADPDVVEAAAVGVPDDVKGEALVCFVVLREARSLDEAVTERLRGRLVGELGKALQPKAIHAVAELPRTRNAKVLRRLVRAAYLDTELGDLSSLENPSALEAISAVRSG
ncbi:MAG: AMP-binding protein [Candidatus Dormibacteria bacterium]